MNKKNKIDINGKVITIMDRNDNDFISLTDMAKYKDSERTDYIIQNWLRNRTTVEFLGI